MRFEWSKEAEEAFQSLKTAFTTAPVLRLFDPDRPCIVETDASDYVSACVLSQKDDQGILHPVAYFSKKHTPAECNYEIYDKELLAVIRCFEEWRAYLEGSPEPIEVLTDHRNLEYFMTSKLLNCRQVRWSEFLSRFNFKIVFRPGKQGAKPDALTRRSGDLPKEGDERLLHQSRVVLKSQNLDLGVFASGFEELSDLEKLFSEGYEKDMAPSEYLKQLKEGFRQSKDISLGDCQEVEGRLQYRRAWYVPDLDSLRLEILRTHHDVPSAGHPGRAKTFELVSREYYWPGMRKFVERYVRNCDTCRRTKAVRHAAYGVLKPLPFPRRPWEDVSVDFVVCLP